MTTSFAVRFDAEFENEQSEKPRVRSPYAVPIIDASAFRAAMLRQHEEIRLLARTAAETARRQYVVKPRKVGLTSFCRRLPAMNRFHPWHAKEQKMTNASFKIGDKVELKSGGPPMTVDYVHTSSKNVTCRCVWFAGTEPHREMHSAVSLRRANLRRTCST